MLNSLLSAVTVIVLTSGDATNTLSTTDFLLTPDDPAQNENILSRTDDAGSEALTGQVTLPLELDLQANPNGTNFTTAVLYFSPVETATDGTVNTTIRNNKKRFQTTLFASFLSGSTTSTRSIINVDEASLSLPTGTYVISEIKYRINTSTSGILTRNFCLSEGSIEFEVNDGENTLLENIVLANLPDNRAQYKNHIPFIDSAVLEKDAAEAQTQNIEFKPFVDETGTCSRGRHYTTTAIQLP